MAATPDTTDALLTRRDAAAALTAAGYPVARATLATRAVRGGGPPFRRFGRVPLYSWGDLLAWAQSRLSPPICSTSEADTLPGAEPAPTGGGARARTRPMPSRLGPHPEIETASR
jgi:hypothetical protein